jgi:hypothetical protein
MRFSKVVAWGHPLHSNTFSYIHSSFLKAFKFLGYETMWLTNEDDVSNIDFSNTLFFTEGQVDQKIPIRNDCYYVLHNCDFVKYPRSRLRLQTYFQNDPLTIEGQYAGERLDNGVYYNREQNMLYQPWATDLLPHEIDLAYAGQPRGTTCHWVGTIGGELYGNINEISPFRKACEENGIAFVHHAPTHTPLDDSVRLIRESYLSPSIHGTYQSKYGYVACRIFKNISYGQLGATNSRAAQGIFEGQLVYNQDTYQLFFDMQKKANDLKRIVSLMTFVRDKHTFLNRIDRILSVL